MWNRHNVAKILSRGAKAKIHKMLSEDVFSHVLQMIYGELGTDFLRSCAFHTCSGRFTAQTRSQHQRRGMVLQAEVECNVSIPLRRSHVFVCNTSTPQTLLTSLSGSPTCTAKLFHAELIVFFFFIIVYFIQGGQVERGRRNSTGSDLDICIHTYTSSEQTPEHL